MGINILNPLHIPLLNTFILLISGVAVTLSHHSLCMSTMKVKFENSKVFTGFELSILSLIAALVLAVEFTL